MIGGATIRIRNRNHFVQLISREENILGAKKRQDASRASNTPEGRYANYFKIGYNAFEFVLDFGQLYDGKKQPILHTRIILSPEYTRNLSTLLKEALEGYEGEFGGK